MIKDSATPSSDDPGSDAPTGSHLAAIVKKEVHSHFLEFRFTIAFILVMLTSIVITWTAAENYAYRTADYHSNITAHREDYQTIRYFWALTYGQIRYELPPNILNIFFGEDDVEKSSTICLQARGMPMREGSHGINPLFDLFPRANFFSFTLFVMSLLAFIFSYDSICGERENGTLRLLLSYGVSRNTIIMAKWLGGILLLLLPYCLAFCSALLIVNCYATLELKPDDLVALLAAFGVSALFIACFYTLGMLVSACTSRSATAILALLLLWTILVLVIPGISSNAARFLVSGHSLADLRKMHETKTRDDFLANQERWIDEEYRLRKEYAQLKQEQPHKLEELNSEMWDKLRGLYISAFEGPLYHDFCQSRKQLIEQTQNRLERILAMENRLAAISPITPYRHSLRELGARYGPPKVWYAHIQRCESAIMDTFFKSMEETPVLWGREFKEAVPIRPELRFPTYPVEKRLGNVLQSIVYLLAASMIFLGLTFLRFARTAIG